MPLEQPQSPMTNPTGAIVVHNEDDAADMKFLLDRAGEILDLLKRAHALNYTLILAPHEMQTLIAVLEVAKLEKQP